MKKLLKNFFLGISVLLGAAVAEAQLYAVVSDEGSGPDIGSLLVIDPASGAIIDAVPMTLSTGGAVSGVVGIAAHPQTRVLYLILDSNPSETDDRRLATVDPASGVVTDIGALGDSYCGLTFGSDGTLYAIAAEQHTDPASVHTVNLATAATTLFRASGDVMAGGFPADDGGESIEFNPADGQLYFNDNFGPNSFQRMNLASKTSSPIPLDSAAVGRGLAYEVESGTFLTYDENAFVRLDPATGDVTILDMDAGDDNTIRDLAFLPQAQAPSAAPALDGVGIVLLLGFLLLVGSRQIARAS